MKQLARQGGTLSLPDALKFERSLAIPVLLSDNVAEGLAAFSERRTPEFK